MDQFFKLIKPDSSKRKGPMESDIINLSHYFRPDEHQKTLLEKGLSFVPTLDIYKQQTQNLKRDVSKYHRRLKLATYFGEGNEGETPRFHLPSYWEPEDEKLPDNLKQLIRKDRATIQKIPGHLKEVENITADQVRALRSLANNQDIVIKPADKGSRIVIMDRQQYVFEGLRQLNNPNHYVELDAPIFKQTAIETGRIITKLREKKYIDQKQERYLRGENSPRTRILYLLPKIHKHPSTWTVPYEIPSARPIVSDCNSETYATAEFIEYYLNPLSIKHPSYIKDTYDFIEKIRNITIPQGAFLFSIDIDSLYTNINTAAGLKAIRDILKKYPDRQRPDAELLELLEINLTKNDFTFDGRTFLQISGTAMGKKFAPSYANIYMALWEETALQKCRLKPTHYFRFLDDIWGTWEHSTEEFEEFIQVLNTHHASITVKYVTNKEQIDFLDVTVFKGKDFNTTGKLDQKVFFKETDTHALLHKTSFHPAHCFTGIVKSQLLRFKRICTQTSDFENACKILFTALRKRGYTRTFLRKSYNTYQEIKVRNNKPTIAMITTYSSQSTLANRSIKRNFENRGADLLQNFNVISAYRKNKNLKDYVVHSELKPWNQRSRAKPNYFSPKHIVKNRANKNIFNIRQTITHNTKNCVYLISCQVCGLQYVGETGNSIAHRLSQHKYTISNEKNTHLLIVQHFMTHGTEALRVCGLEHNERWSVEERRFHEKEWITRLNTKYPGGLNY